MSLDLHDQRVKLTPEAHCALGAESRVTGKDRSELCREILHEWAMRKIHVAKLTLHNLDCEGISWHPGDKCP
jgi:hypothetical protein